MYSCIWDLYDSVGSAGGPSKLGRKTIPSPESKKAGCSAANPLEFEVPSLHDSPFDETANPFVTNPTEAKLELEDWFYDHTVAHRELELLTGIWSSKRVPKRN